jgi:RNA polymerase sigma-70 factor, ECF subfamily
MKAQHMKCDRHDSSDVGRHDSFSVAADERRLVSAAKNGDSVSFEILCKQSANMVFRVARRITPTMEDAEDVVQESFQLAFINLKKFKGNCRFSTWLTRIVTNAALMRLRKNRVRRELPLEEPWKYQPHRSPYQVEDQRLNPEQLYAQEEQHRMLVEAVNALDPGLRWAMELRELDERSTAEAAHMMGVPLGTLKARLFRGRRKLRQLLNRMEPAQLTREVNYSWGRQMRYSDSD